MNVTHWVEYVHCMYHNVWNLIQFKVFFMEFVQPIRDKEIIEKMKFELSKTGLRDQMLFIFGINSGLRISDILKLKVKDVKNMNHIILRETKTNKEKRFRINTYLREMISQYIHRMNDHDCLFQSRKGLNSPLSRVQAYRIINNAAKNVGIQDKIGTHTLRKTFGYHHYQMHKDVALLQTIFNHSAPSVTLKYIGLNEDIIDQSIENFYL